MKIYHKERRKKGYSLAELLTVVAITVILCAITVVGARGYYKHLKQMEMDQTAKEIYIAAQNHLTYADANGELAQYHEASALSKLGGKITEANRPADMTQAEWDENKDDYYYIVYNPTTDKSNLTNTILKEMLPMGAIDGTVREAGSYIIEYSLKTATIYGVFYTEKGQENPLVAGDEIQNLLPGNGYRGSPKDRMKYQSVSGEKFPLGYYGGSIVSVPKAEKIETPTIEVLNGDQLVLKITDLNDPNDIEAQLTVEITGDESQAKKVLVLDAADATKDANNHFVYTVTLDDITKANQHFAELFKGFTPGEDITITAQASGKNKLTPIVTTKPTTTNSLFNSVTKETDEYGNVTTTANISSIRHLENLDPVISGMAEEKITAASQLASTQAEFANEMGISLSVTGDDQLDYTIFKEVVGPTFNIYKKGETNASTTNSYYSITNKKLTLYNGNKLQIKNLHIKNQANAGMFSKITLAKPKTMTISNLTLWNPTIEGTKNVGAIAGVVSKDSHLTLQNVSVDCDNQKHHILGDGNYEMRVGGLVGLLDSNWGAASATITIKNSFVRGENLAVYAIGYDPTVGGMVGLCKSNLITIDKSYSTALVASRSNGVGSTSHKWNDVYVGGLIGRIIKPISGSKISNCYVGGRTEKGGKYKEDSGNVIADNTRSTSPSTNNISAGGLVGCLEPNGDVPTDIELDNCYTTASVKGVNNKAGYEINLGGLIGRVGHVHSQKDGKLAVKIGNSYATGLIVVENPPSNKASENLGTFIGRLNQGRGNTIQKIANNYVLSGINPSEVEIVGNVSASPIAQKTNTDTIGAKKTYTAHPYDTQLPANEFKLRPVIDETHYGDWPIPDLKCETSLVYYETFDNKTYYFEGNFDKDKPTEKQSYYWDGTTLTKDAEFIKANNNYLKDSGYALVLTGNLDNVEIKFGERSSLKGENEIKKLGEIAPETKLNKALGEAIGENNGYKVYHFDAMPSWDNTSHGDIGQHGNWFKNNVYPLLTKDNPDSLLVTIESNGTFSAKYGYIPYLARTAQSFEESNMTPTIGKEFEVRALNQYEELHILSIQDKAVTGNKDVTIHQTLDVDFNLRSNSKLIDKHVITTQACVIDGSIGLVDGPNDKDQRYWLKGLDGYRFVKTVKSDAGQISNFNFKYMETPNEQYETRYRRVAHANAGIIDSIDIECDGNQEVYLYNAIADTNSGSITKCKASNFIMKYPDKARVGGLVGVSSGSTIAECEVSDFSMDYILNATQVGGLVGLTDASTIKNNKVTDVSISHIQTQIPLHIGGLIGQSLSTVTGCTVENINISNVTNSLSVGGLIGQSLSTVTGCTVSGATMSQIINPLYVGGLIGESSGKVTTCTVSELKTDVASTIAGFIHTSHNGGSIAKCKVENSTINHQTITPRSMPEMNPTSIKKEMQKLDKLPIASTNKKDKLVVFETKDVARFAKDAQTGTINNKLAVRASAVQAAGFVYKNEGKVTDSHVIDCKVIGKSGTNNAGFVFQNWNSINNCSVNSTGTKPTQIFGDGFVYENTSMGTINNCKVEKIGYANQSDTSISGNGFATYNFQGNITNSHVINCPIVGTAHGNAGFIHVNSGEIDSCFVTSSGNLKTRINGVGFAHSNYPTGTINKCRVEKTNNTNPKESSISGCGFVYQNEGMITDSHVLDHPRIGSFANDGGFIFTNLGTIKKSTVKGSKAVDVKIIGSGFADENTHKGVITNCSVEQINYHDQQSPSIISSGFVNKNGGNIENSHVKNCRVIGKFGVESAGFVYGNAPTGEITNCSVEDIRTINYYGFAYLNNGTIINPYVSNCYIKGPGLVHTNNDIVKRTNPHAKTPTIIHCTIDGPGVIEHNGPSGVMKDIDVVNSQIAKTGFVNMNWGEISNCQLYSDRKKYQDYLKRYVNGDNSWKPKNTVENMRYRPGNIMDGYNYEFDNDYPEITKETVTADVINALIGENGNLYTLMTIGKNFNGEIAKDAVGFVLTNNNKVRRSSVTANFIAENKGRRDKGNIAGFVMNNYSFIDFCYVNLNAAPKDKLATFSGFANLHSDGTANDINSHTIQNSFAIGNGEIDASYTSGFVYQVSHRRNVPFSVNHNYSAVYNDRVNNSDYLKFTTGYSNVNSTNCFNVQNEASDSSNGYDLINNVKYGSQKQIATLMKNIGMKSYLKSIVIPYNSYVKELYPYGYFGKDPFKLYGNYLVDDAELKDKNVYVSSVTVTKQDMDADSRAWKSGNPHVYLRQITVWYYNDETNKFESKKINNLGFYAEDTSVNDRWFPRERHIVDVNLEKLNSEYDCKFRTVAHPIYRPIFGMKYDIKTTITKNVQTGWNHIPFYGWDMYDSDDAVEPFNQANYERVFPDDKYPASAYPSASARSVEVVIPEEADDFDLDDDKLDSTSTDSSTDASVESSDKPVEPEDVQESVEPQKPNNKPVEPEDSDADSSSQKPSKPTKPEKEPAEDVQESVEPQKPNKKPVEPASSSTEASASEASSSQESSASEASSSQEKSSQASNSSKDNTSTKANSTEVSTKSER